MTNIRKGNFLKPSLNENGYLYVSLWKENRQHTRSVHRLVAQAYVPNPDNKPFVNHIDANRANPHKDNLEWVTQSENIEHAYRLGTMSQKQKLATPELQQCLDEFLAGATMTEIAQKRGQGLSRLSIHLRNQAVRTGQVEAFTAELIRQKTIRNTQANESKRKEIHQYSLTGVLVATYPSMTAAAKALGKTTSGPISNVLAGIQQSAYGFQWKYP